MGLIKYIKNYKIKRHLRLYASKNDPIYSLDGIKCWAKIVDCYDGDTCTIVIFLENKRIKYKARMKGYDSPEMKPLLNEPDRDEIKKNAIKAKNRFIELVGGINSIVWVECGKFDKYGRLLLVVYPKNSTKCITVNEIMIQEGFGYSYDGGTKKNKCVNFI